MMAITTSNGRASVALTRDINVTPMIDVLLVLLIVFMAAIPGMRKALDVQLPELNATEKQGSPSIVLELHGDGTASINGGAVSAGGLSSRLREIYDGRRDKVLFVKGDPTLRYAAIVDAMDIARGAGVRVIGWP